jgi:hypothetical protein
MKIFEFFLKCPRKMVGAGANIFDKLELEPNLLTSWSWSHTKIDQLHNTVQKGITQMGGNFSCKFFPEVPQNMKCF